MSNKALLSRMADSLYWMSRYLERAEHTARMLMVNLNMTLDESSAKTQLRWARLFEALHIEPPRGGDIDDYTVTRLLTFDRENANSILGCIIAARENARNARAQISSEMWEHLNELYLHFKSNSLDAIWEEGPFGFLRSVRNGSHMFEGITDSTMNHGEGWHFIQAGRFMERAYGIANLLTVHHSVFSKSYNENDLENETYLDLLGILKSCTAFEAYCKIYTASLVGERTVELLLLNPEFPHSIRFSLDRLGDALDCIADITSKRKNIRTNRLVGRLKAELSYDQIEEVMADGLEQYLGQITRRCGEIHLAIQETYVSYPVQAAIM